ncbi:HAD-IA family hydrolase [Lacimonas salitolerans]|uniref:HAD-IA family hydrolase n=1 Tax=Lacimonas salitolerans TaxID=1323750 RepID=A0ABW4EI54_9RHOB
MTQVLRIDHHYEDLQKTDDVRAFYTERQRCEAIVEAICDAAIKKKVQVISYDVFDTALLRECKSEAQRFWDISERFITQCREEGNLVSFEAEDAVLARATAARAAYSISRSIAGNREGRFDDIARTTCDLLGHPELTDAYVANELAYELTALVTNPLLGMVADALPRTRLIFVSDMYLESAKITHLLMEKFGPKVVGRVYSSADGIGSKRTGGIFSYLEETLRVSGDKILHIGDSLHSDYKMPKASGWNSFYLPLPDSEKKRRRDCYDAVKDRFAQTGVTLEKYLHFNL